MFSFYLTFSLRLYDMVLFRHFFVYQMVNNNAKNTPSYLCYFGRPSGPGRFLSDLIGHCVPSVTKANCVLHVHCPWASLAVATVYQHGI